MPDTPMGAVPRLRKRLVFRLIATFGGASALVLIVAMFISAQVSEQSNVEEHTVYARDFARLTARRFDATFDALTTAGRSIALGLESMEDPSSARVERLLRQVLGGSNDVHATCAVWLPDFPLPSLYLQRGGGAVPLRYDPRDRSWLWSAVEKGRSTWSDPHFGEPGDTRVVTASLPFTRKGQIAGVAAVDVALERLAQEALQLHPSRTGYVFLTNRGGQLLAFPVAGEAVLDPPLLAELLGGEGIYRGKDPWKHEPAWVSYHSLRSAPFVVGVVTFEREVLDDSRLLRHTLLSAAAANLVVLMILVVLIARSVTRPMEALLEVVRRVTGGDLGSTMPAISTDDEMAELSMGFNMMMRELHKQMQEVAKVTAERERLVRELQIAAEIQRSFLPRVPPDEAAIVLHAHTQEAMQVGGDFYDYFALRDGRVVIAIGDACGEGIPAALFMAMTLTLLRAHLRSTGRPSTTLTQANALVSEDNPSTMFVTVFIGVLDPRSGRLEWSNAGHPPPLLRGADGELRSLIAPPQIMIGVIPDAVYEDTVTQLQPGDRLVLFTDGAIEARGRDGQFGVGGLSRVIAQDGGGDPQALVQSIEEAVRAFAPGPLQDDTTLLVMDFVGEHFVLSNDLSEMARLPRWVEEVAARHGMSSQARGDLNLILEEYLVNLIEYAFPEGRRHEIRVDAAARDGELRVRVEDDGRPFDPRQGPAEPDEDAVGGRGLRIIRAKALDLEYSRGEVGNVLSFRVRSDTTTVPADETIFGAGGKSNAGP